MNKELPRYLKYTVFAAIILSGLTLILFAYMGTFMRMATDDYCNTAIGLNYGAVNGVIYQYQNWSGRYTSFFMEFALASVRPAIHPWIIFLTFIAWLALIYYILYQLSHLLKLSLPRFVYASISLIFVFTLYRIVPTNQHIFWVTAIIPYVFPLLFGLIFVGSLIQYFRQKRSIPIFIAMCLYSAVMVILLGGFTEVFSPFMLMIFSLMLLGIPFVPVVWRREYLVFLLIGLVFALITMFIILSSPATHIRQTVDFKNVETASLWTITSNSVLGTISFLFGEFVGITFGQSFALAYLSSFFVTFLLGGLVYLQAHPELELPAPKRLGLAAGIVGGAAFILILAVMATLYYGVGLIPIRPLIVPRFIELVMVFCWAYLSLVAFQRYHILQNLRKTRTWPYVLLALSFLILWSPSFSLIKYARLVPQFQAYAQSWDKRNGILLNTPEDKIAYVEPLDFEMANYLQLYPLTGLDNAWNQCAAEIYGIKGIVVKADSSGKN